MNPHFALLEDMSTADAGQVLYFLTMAMWTGYLILRVRFLMGIKEGK